MSLNGDLNGIALVKTGESSNQEGLFFEQMDVDLESIENVQFFPKISTSGNAICAVYLDSREGESNHTLFAAIWDANTQKMKSSGPIPIGRGLISREVLDVAMNEATCGIAWAEQEDRFPVQTLKFQRLDTNRPEPRATGRWRRGRVLWRAGCLHSEG